MEGGTLEVYNKGPEGYSVLNGSFRWGSWEEGSL